jgi:hypothetical protein
MKLHLRWIPLVLLGSLWLAGGRPPDGSAREVIPLCATPAASVPASAPHRELPTPAVHHLQPPPAALTVTPLVTVTEAGLWLTYPTDGEGNPLAPAALAQDPTTGDLWLQSNRRITRFSASGQWQTFSVSDFGYAPPHYFADVALDGQGRASLGMVYPYYPSDT